jgi:hypothetical protein
MKRLLNNLFAATITCLTLALLLGAPMRSYAQPAPTSPLDVVKAAFDAQNANDPAAMRALIAPDATFVQPLGSPGSNTQSREEFIAGVTGPNNSHVNTRSVQQTAPDTVIADVIISGGDTPRLPHPFHIQATITVTGGLIRHAVIMFAPETQEDIAALGPMPGMPTTGAGPGNLPLRWGLLGLLFLLVGALMHHAHRVAPGPQ